VALECDEGEHEQDLVVAGRWGLASVLHPDFERGCGIL